MNKPLHHAIYQKVNWRLLPILFSAYIFAYLDRINVSFAKLQMLSDLKFSETIYGLGAGVFFIGYTLVEIPSNILLNKYGARRWIARILISWGIISIAMIWVKTPTMFYLLRFLLGVAEAGFFPGIIYYLSRWYPEYYRGRIYTVFMTAVAVSGIIGGPVSGAILNYMADTGGLHGWQWLFILEAAPAVLIGIFIIFYLDDNINAANWLNSTEKEILLTNLAPPKDMPKAHIPSLQLLKNRNLWRLALIYFCLSTGLYGVGFWLPTIIKSYGVKSDFSIGLLSALPYLLAMVSMLLLGKSSDRCNERIYHLSITVALAACSLIVLLTIKSNLFLSILCLSIANAGIISSIALFWTLPTREFNGVTAAIGIAFINSCGNIAGFVAPYLFGLLKDLYGSIIGGMHYIISMLFIGCLLILLNKFIKKST